MVRLCGTELPAVDHLPTHEPRHGGFYLGYKYNSYEIGVFTDGFDYKRGWIRLGPTPSNFSVATHIAYTYIESVGKLKDDAFKATILTAVDRWEPVTEQDDAFIFENRYGTIALAVRDSDGDLVSGDDWVLTTAITTGVPLVIGKTDD